MRKRSSDFKIRNRSRNRKIKTYNISKVNGITVEAPKEIGIEIVKIFNEMKIQNNGHMIRVVSLLPLFTKKVREAHNV